MFEKLAKIKARYLELTDRLADPAVIARQDEWQKVAKEHSSLEEVVARYDEYLAAQDFKEDNPFFLVGKAALQAALGWTDEKVEALLSQCVAEE